MANILNLGNNKNQNNTNSPKPKVSIKQSVSIECKKCGHDIYLSAVHLRKIPKVLTATPQDVILPIDVFLCASCGALNTELLPLELHEFFKDE